MEDPGLALAHVLSLNTTPLLQLNVLAESVLVNSQLTPALLMYMTYSNRLVWPQQWHTQTRCADGLLLLHIYSVDYLYTPTVVNCEVGSTWQLFDRLTVVGSEHWSRGPCASFFCRVFRISYFFDTGPGSIQYGLFMADVVFSRVSTRWYMRAHALVPVHSTSTGTRTPQRSQTNTRARKHKHSHTHAITRTRTHNTHARTRTAMHKHINTQTHGHTTVRVENSAFSPLIE